jgi:hypothetical protein
MSKRKHRVYGWDFKAEVLAVYEVDGPAVVRDLWGGHPSETTIIRWARECGVGCVAETKRQTEAANVLLQARRLRIRDKLAERAEEMLDRMAEAMTIYVGSGATPMPVEVERPSASVCRDLATTAGILIDKLRLESGEATERVEHNDIAKDTRERLAGRISSIAASAGAGQATRKPD